MQRRSLDPRAWKATREVPPRMKSMQTILPHALHRRGALEKSFRRARVATLEGDYFEFGLYRGSAFAHAVRVARRHLPASPMRFFGFDSFRGLPPLTGVDKATGEFSQGQFACALSDVRAKLDGKVDWSRAHLVEGWFEDSLTQELKDCLRPGPVAVALIDCDLYGSTVSVLAFLEDFLQEGSMLLFDDWDCFGRQDHMGERRAFREFLEARPWFTPEKWIRFGRRGQAFIMHIGTCRDL
jgi:O-methyltransferase